MTIDVSAGGLAIYLNDYPRRGRGPGRTNARDSPAGRAPRAARAAGHWCAGCAGAPKGSLYRNVCGLQFRYADDMERELVKEYVGYIRAKYKL